MIVCKICGRQFKQLGHRHLNTHGITTLEYKEKFNVTSLTSREYLDDREQTFLKRYGVKNNFGRADVKAKIDQKESIKTRRRTLMNKYHVENISQLSDVKDKVRNTCLRRYGVVSNLRIPGVLEKSIATTLHKSNERKISGEAQRAKDEYKERQYRKTKVHSSFKQGVRRLFRNKQGNVRTKDMMMSMGYSICDLESHLKTTLPKGISWEMFLSERMVWSIDHIIPVSLYNIKEVLDDEFKKCWNYRNLRIISIKENSKKINKLDMDIVRYYRIEDLLPSSTKNKNS